MKLNKDDRREEMAAYGTMIIVSTAALILILAFIFRL
jgi:hypothetical protein